MKAMFVYLDRDDRNALVKGYCRDWLKANNFPAMYSASNRGWWIRKSRVADLLARADRDGITVRVKDVVR